MNAFLASHRTEFKTFIDTICDISPDRATSAIPPSYATPITILGRLPATSKEGFPSLPYLIDQARECAALVGLWLDSKQEAPSNPNPSGSQHSSLSEEVAKFDELCTTLMQRTRDCLSQAEQAERPSGILEVKWEELVSQMDKKARLRAADEKRSPSPSPNPSTSTKPPPPPPSSPATTAPSEKRSSLRDSHFDRQAASRRASTLTRRTTAPTSSDSAAAAPDDDPDDDIHSASSQAVTTPPGSASSVPWDAPPVCKRRHAAGSDNEGGADGESGGGGGGGVATRTATGNGSGNANGGKSSLASSLCSLETSHDRASHAGGAPALGPVAVGRDGLAAVGKARFTEFVGGLRRKARERGAGGGRGDGGRGGESAVELR